MADRQPLTRRPEAEKPRREQAALLLPSRELLYGRHAILETLRARRRRVYCVYLERGTQQSGIVQDIVSASREQGCPVVEAPQAIVAAVGAANHQGVLAETGPYPYNELDDILPPLWVEQTSDAVPEPPAGGRSDLYLLFDHLQDVQNAGSLLRTAEAMAVRGVVIPHRRAAGVTPAVVHASAGAVEHLHVALVGNIVQTIEQIKKAGVWVVGLDASVEAVPLERADLSGALAIVVGAEGTGLSRLAREHCDWLLAIPMHGRVTSLNASVAGSVALIWARHSPMRR